MNGCDVVIFVKVIDGDTCVDNQACFRLGWKNIRKNLILFFQVNIQCSSPGIIKFVQPCKCLYLMIKMVIEFF